MTHQQSFDPDDEFEFLFTNIRLSHIREMNGSHNISKGAARHFAIRHVPLVIGSRQSQNYVTPSLILNKFKRIQGL